MFFLEKYCFNTISTHINSHFSLHALFIFDIKSATAHNRKKSGGAFSKTPPAYRFKRFKIISSMLS